MPKSLAEFIEAVGDGTVLINQQDLVDLITKTKNAHQLQKALLEDFDCDVLFRDCQIMISLYGKKNLQMATAPGGPHATMKY
jgi:hypothetical protein